MSRSLNRLSLVGKIFLKLLLFLIGTQNNAYSQKVDHNHLLKDIITSGDRHKVEAAKFLVENVNDKFYYDGDELRSFDELFNILGDIQKYRKISNVDRSLNSKMDSLRRLYGRPDQMTFDILPDSAMVSKNLLLENLEYAFKVKSEKSWLKNMPDSLFHEYILPYRVGTERLEENQRSHLYNTYNFIKKVKKEEQIAFDLNKSINLQKFAADVQKEISKRINLNRTMWEYPFDIPISKMELGKQGSCKHLVNYTTAAMRSVGLPVVSDFSNRWGNNWTGHKWNVLILENMSEIPFDAGNPSISFNLEGRNVVKVFREQFGENKSFKSPSELEVPPTLYNKYWKDVTRTYTKVTDIVINVPKDVRDRVNTVLIGTFDNSAWAPQFYAEIEGEKATFREMGTANVYIGMYYMYGGIITFGDPFIIDSLGNQRILSPKKEKIDQVLFRKYPQKKAIINYEQTVIGGRFDLYKDDTMTKSDFTYVVNHSPDSVVTINLPSDNYRYIKYTFPNISKSYLAEISIFDKDKAINLRPLSSKTDKQLLSLNDKSLETYYTGKKGQTITYGLGDSLHVSSIKFAPRSDSNYLIEGDEYELCYWKNGKWISISKKKASSSILLFSSIPKNALCLLHNLSRGKEERIFTYDDGKQVWW
jgi:hypothetical protein